MQHGFEPINPKAVREPEPGCCPCCGTPIDEAANFCPCCGERITEAQPIVLENCPNCGASLDGDESYCTACGECLTHDEPESDAQKERPLESKIALGIILAVVAIAAVWLAISGLSNLSRSL